MMVLEVFGVGSGTSRTLDSWTGTRSRLGLQAGSQYHIPVFCTLRYKPCIYLESYICIHICIQTYGQLGIALHLEHLSCLPSSGRALALNNSRVDEGSTCPVARRLQGKPLWDSSLRSEGPFRLPT